MTLTISLESNALNKVRKNYFEKFNFFYNNFKKNNLTNSLNINNFNFKGYFSRVNIEI